jgi:hypothetical protein
LELLAGPFLAFGIVAVIDRFVVPVRELRLPGIVDRSIAMYLIRSMRGTLPAAPPPDALVDAIAAPDPAPADRSTLVGDLLATPDRLAAVGVIRAVPIRLARGPRPILLPARSIPATRLPALPALPLWRRILMRRA